MTMWGVTRRRKGADYTLAAPPATTSSPSATKPPATSPPSTNGSTQTS